MDTNANIDTDPAIRTAAAGVATMAARRARTEAALATATDHEARLRARLGALDAERAAIVSRRARGEQEADDAGRLALIDADMDGLAVLEAEAAAAVAAARQAHEIAEQGLAGAQATLARAEAVEAVRLLAAHATELDQRLAATLDRLAAASEQIGVASPWRPTPAFYASVRRAALAAGLL